MENFNTELAHQNLSRTVFAVHHQYNDCIINTRQNTIKYLIRFHQYGRHEKSWISSCETQRFHVPLPFALLKFYSKLPAKLTWSPVIWPAPWDRLLALRSISSHADVYHISSFSKIPKYHMNFLSWCLARSTWPNLIKWLFCIISTLVTR